MTPVNRAGRAAAMTGGFDGVEREEQAPCGEAQQQQGAGPKPAALHKTISQAPLLEVSRRGGPEGRELRSRVAEALQISRPRPSLSQGKDAGAEGGSPGGASSSGGDGDDALAAVVSSSETAPVEPPPRLSLRGFLLFLGPGLLMSVAYLVRRRGGGRGCGEGEGQAGGGVVQRAGGRVHDAPRPPPSCPPRLQDPGNLQADVQAGANTGFELLWWFAFVMLGCVSGGGRGARAAAARLPLLAAGAAGRLMPARAPAPPRPPLCRSSSQGMAFQCMSGRLGLMTGRDLAQHCGNEYPRFARIFLWLMIEIAIVGADIQETVGCAQAVNMLSNGAVPLWAGARRAAGSRMHARALLPTRPPTQSCLPARPPHPPTHSPTTPAHLPRPPPPHTHTQRLHHRFHLSLCAADAGPHPLRTLAGSAVWHCAGHRGAQLCCQLFPRRHARRPHH